MLWQPQRVDRFPTSEVTHKAIMVKQWSIWLLLLLHTLFYSNAATGAFVILTPMFPKSNRIGVKLFADTLSPSAFLPQSILVDILSRSHKWWRNMAMTRWCQLHIVLWCQQWRWLAGMSWENQVFENLDTTRVIFDVAILSRLQICLGSSKVSKG